MDVFDAVYSMKQESEKADKAAKVGHAIAGAVNYYIDQNLLEVESSKIWSKASELAGFTVSPILGGQVLSSFEIPKRQNYKGKYLYDLSVLCEDGKEK